MNPEAETVRDVELLKAIGGGDERALAELHRRYAAVVFSFVLARVADRGAAEVRKTTLRKIGGWIDVRKRRRGKNRMFGDLGKIFPDEGLCA